MVAIDASEIGGRTKDADTVKAHRHPDPEGLMSIGAGRGRDAGASVQAVPRRGCGDAERGTGEGSELISKAL